MKQKTAKKKNDKPTVVSLFSGAGGMDLGFQRAGFELIWANDNFLDATETYKKNIDERIDSSKIEDVPLESIPYADIIIGGFPCQGFSVANTKRSVDDSRNTLYRYFVKIVTEKQPKFFLAENVKGLLNMAGGKVFEKIVEDFSNAGYTCVHHLFNAADYGVPQSRQRVMILGVRNDLNMTVGFPPAVTHSKNAFGDIKKHISVGEALKDIPEPEAAHNLKNHVYSKYKAKYNGYVSNRRLDPNKPSPTVTARGDEKGGAMIMPHPFRDRRLSCREVATIQGFPPDFEFVGSMTSIYRQIGNAVPPPLAEAVAKTIKAAMTSKPTAEFAKQKKTSKLVGLF